jgi:hypothetical protein
VVRLPAVRRQLPRRTGSFERRSFELGRLHAWLEADEGWLISVLGPPGIGKSRLVLEVVAENSALSACWVDLRSSRPLADIAESAGTETDEDAVVRALREGTDLVVLDGASAPSADLSSLVTRLAERLPHLRFVVTARRALGMPGEELLFVSSFGLPKDGEPLEASPAGALFLAARARAGADAPLTAEEELDVRRILKRVGQLPLATELVAAQVAELGAQAFADRMERPLDWIVRGEENPLRLALDSSAQALTPAAKKLLVDCAWLGRAFDVDDLAVLAGPDALRIVRGLRTSSWLVQADDEERAYDLLPPVRQYVDEQLASSMGMPVLAATAVLLGLARGRRAPMEVVERAFRTPGVSTASCEAAFGPAFHLFASSGAGEAYVRLAHELADLRVLTPVAADLAVARGSLDIGRFDAASEALARVSASGDASSRQDAAMLTARLHFRTGAYDALRSLSASLVPRRAEDVEVLATAARMRGDHELGMAIYARALERIEAPLERAIVHLLRARYLVEGGHAEEGARDVETAVAGCGGDRRLLASAACTRALIAHDHERLDEALGWYDEGVALYAALGSPLAAYIRCSRFLATIQTGRRDEAYATALAVLADAPPKMTQLGPFVTLAHWLLEGAAPSAVPVDGTVVSAAHALVCAYVARCQSEGDAVALEAALAANRPHEGWSVVSRALRRLAQTTPVLPRPPSGRADEAVLIGPGARWFARTGHPQTSLETRPVLARVLAAVAEASERAPDGRVSLDAIADAAWPGERMIERAKRSRVHVAISTLRKLGLGAELSYTPAGYRLLLPVLRAS